MKTKLKPKGELPRDLNIDGSIDHSLVTKVPFIEKKWKTAEHARMGTNFLYEGSQIHYPLQELSWRS